MKKKCSKQSKWAIHCPRAWLYIGWQEECLLTTDLKGEELGVGEIWSKCECSVQRRMVELSEEQTEACVASVVSKGKNVM